MRLFMDSSRSVSDIVRAVDFAGFDDSKDARGGSGGGGGGGGEGSGSFGGSGPARRSEPSSGGAASDAAVPVTVPWKLKVVVREFTPLDPAWEFRGFVYVKGLQRNILVCICAQTRD
jgi:hypothetical protein